MSTRHKREWEDEFAFVEEYSPDDEKALRFLLIVAGLSPDEIERAVEEIGLDSEMEM